MRRLWAFISGLIVALALFLTTISWYALDYHSGNSMSNIMGQMMGGQYSGLVNPMPTYVWFSLIVLVVALAISVVGTVYYVVYPEIKQSTADGIEADKRPSSSDTVDKVIHSNLPSNPALSSKESWSMLMRTSKPEEKRILEVLSAHNGVYLQKLIVKETGLSKLKTHRIISRFVERGIVNATKSGNTNEVRLSPWLNQTPQTGNPAKAD
ncbi:MAG: hypothetical protein OK439_02550 [Thaumarchaeota archaeon]|nr:hypothetical protein [Nitrososphaerota archaeon]